LIAHVWGEVPDTARGGLPLAAVGSGLDAKHGQDR
jgi:hypothetical protein